jgi:hypothetical protein
MRIRCVVGETTITNEEGIEVDSVEAVCRRCGHETESYGTGEDSILRCLALMREECPRNEKNFYVNG